MEKPSRIMTGPGIRARRWGGRGYLCLNDIAHLASRRVRVADWLRNQSTLEHLAAWERLHNTAFNYGEFAIIRDKYEKSNGHLLSTHTWIEATNSVGLQALRGRHGGTYAVLDIAMHFARWAKPTPLYPLQLGAVFHGSVRDTQYATRILQGYFTQPN